MKKIFSLLLLLGFAVATPIDDVDVRGVDPVLSALARLALPFGIGDEPGDLEAAGAAIMETGYFREAKVTLEGDILVVTVAPNPPITKVSVEAKAFPPEALVRYLDDQEAIAVENTYNVAKANEAALAIGKLFRQQGFPFTPEVKVDANVSDQGAELNFIVNEAADIKSFDLEELTLVDKGAASEALAGANKEGKFDFAGFREGILQINRAYNLAGYRYSGVNLAKTNLTDGVLKISVNELRIGEISSKEVDITELGLKIGDPFNWNVAYDDVSKLSRKLGRVVNMVPEEMPDGQIRLTFELGEQAYGPISEIKIEGSSAVAPGVLIEGLRLKVGDQYDPILAQEDFTLLAEKYQEVGLEISPQPAVSYKDGVYTLTVLESKISGYDIKGLVKTNPDVVIRELPKVGSLWSVPALRRSIQNLLATQIFSQPPDVTKRAAEKPGEYIVELNFVEGSTVVLVPNIGLNQLGGKWSVEGEFSLSDKNLWGLAHAGDLKIGGTSNDAGQYLSGSVGYQIPWIYDDFADFKQVKTTASVNIFSNPLGNQELSEKTTLGGDPSNREYTERSTGISFGIGRAFSAEIPNLYLNGGFSWTWKSYFLEPVTDSTITTYTPDSEVILPQNKQTVSFSFGVGYSEIDNPFFPTKGWALQATARPSISYLPTTSSGFAPVTVTGKTYFRLTDDGSSVIALRASIGQIFGQPLETDRFAIGGYGGDFSQSARGYDANYLKNGTGILSGTAEFRQDFGLNPTGGTQVSGFLFADFASISGADVSYGSGAHLTVAPGDTLPDPTSKSLFGVGFGVDVRLDLLGGLLPPFQVGLGFSENSKFKLFFHLGPNF